MVVMDGTRFNKLPSRVTFGEPVKTPALMHARKDDSFEYAFNQLKYRAAIYLIRY